MSIPESQFIRMQQPELLQEFAEAAEVFSQLLALSTAVCDIEELEELLNLILSKSRELTCSDAGSVYLIDDSDGIPKLIFKVAQNDSQQEASLREFAMPVTSDSLAGYVAMTGESLNLPDAYDLPVEAAYHLDYSFDDYFCYRTRSVLVLPMRNHQGQIIGVLQLINRKVKPDIVVTLENVLEVTQPYSDLEEQMVRSLLQPERVSSEE